jgi:catechol 2,3-dioxygenase-like lactoylglutathione lyase family enzyme
MATTLPLAPAVRFHLSLNVADLARSVGFYRTLFGREPAKRHADYAKFELDDPPLVLSLEPNRHGAGGALNHAGFRLPDSAALVAVQERLEAAGIRTQREEGVECCYARQTKFWVQDPDQTLWEIYILEEDLEHRGLGQAPERVPPPEDAPATPVVWEHVLGKPFPEAIPLADGTADEVRLRGTFNVPLGPAEQRRIAGEALRVLRPGGQIELHLLVADRPLDGPPSLPGPAAWVRYVPPEAEPLRALEAAGFAGLELTKFDGAPCFRQGAAEMREMKLVGWKPGTGSAPAALLVLYKGPFRLVTDDAGNVYRRGERVAVSAAAGELLRQGPYADHFTVFTGAGPQGCCST